MVAIPPFRWRLAVFMFCISGLSAYYLEAEFAFFSEYAIFRSVLANVTQVTNPTDLLSAPDGFVYINADISSDPPVSHDPIFPGFHIPSILVRRRSQVCKPTKASSKISLNPGISSDWVDESLLVYSRADPPLSTWYPSANFSARAHILGMAVSRPLLDTGIFRMEAAHSTDITQPTNLTKFPRRWFYASNTDDLQTRLRAAQDDALSLETVIRAALFVVTAIIFQTGFFASSSLHSATTPEEAAAYIMEHCTKGDLRLQHLFFRPGTVSMIAWKSGQMLTTRTVKGRLIGTILRGQVLVNEMFDLQMGGLAEERDNGRLALVAAIAIGSFVIAGGGVSRVVIYTVAGLVIGGVRAFIWNEGVMMLSVWVTAALVAVPTIVLMMRRLG
jgi:hypothetical protein